MGTSTGNIELRVQTRICTTCHIEKGLDSFHKDKKSPLGCVPRCKVCTNSYTRAYASKQEVKEKKIKQNIAWRENNRDRYLARCKKYYEDNKEKQIAYVKNRRKNDPVYKLTMNLRNRIRRAVFGGYKSGSAVSDLGCNIVSFRVYLEDRFYKNKKDNRSMTWDNYGVNGWHIDHIIPLSSFDLSDREQFLKACHYTNLQPLWAEDNFTKGKRVENFK